MSLLVYMYVLSKKSTWAQGTAKIFFETTKPQCVYVTYV